MKLYLLIRLLYVFSLAVAFIFPAVAQDTLTLVNGSRIVGLVNEVLPNEIKYKRYDNPEGPLYTVVKDEVIRIIYSNGTLDEFAKQPIQQQQKADIASPSIRPPENRSFKEITARGNSVYVEIPDPSSRAGERYFVEALQEWGYWKVVSNLEEADLIIVFNIDKEIMLDKSAFVVIKDRDDKKLCASRSYRSSTSAFNGYNAFRSVAMKVVRKYFEEDFD